jgi:hypothetical protein
MEQVHVKESNSEVLVFIDRNMGDRINALEEATRILQREVIREKSTINGTLRRPDDTNRVPER